MRSGWHNLMRRNAARSFAVPLALLATGCVSFPLPPFDHLVRHTDARTDALRSRSVADRPLNCAASLPARSQAEIKQRVSAFWEPSRRIDQIANYHGLVATRHSQLNTVPGPAFSRGMLSVQHLGRETTVDYIAAFHAGRRLPLVVGISGINGTVDGKVTVDLLQDLYDSGDFHVIHLESVTSVEHEVRNRRPFAGGFPEGLLLYETIAAVRSKPEYERQIAQVHLAGVSFGGLLSGFAAHCESQFQRGVIDGAVLAFSPPLDLNQLFQNIAHLPYIHNRIHQSYLEDGLKKFVRHGVVQVDRDPKDIDFDDYMRLVAVPYVQQVYPELKQHFPELRPIQNSDDLYALSRMQPFFESLAVPYFYIYAYDDPVLSPDDHFVQVLQNCSNPLVDGMLVPDGGHLGFDTVTISPFTTRVALDYFRYWSKR